jgi:RNA polymerase sigma-70 factor (ECF subfamily)
MPDEHSLLVRAHELEEEALAEIFDTYYRRLYRYIYHHTCHVQTAEDLTARVFHRLLEALHRGTGPKRHLKPWLFRVAHNLVIDDGRRRHHTETPLYERFLPVSSDFEAATDQAIAIQHIQMALGSLTTGQRSVIILHFLEGLEYREIAQILNSTIGAVKALQNRGLAALRRQLEPTYQGEQP